MVSTRRSKNTAATAGAADKTPAKKGTPENENAAAAAARPRRTCRKTAGTHTRGSGTTATASASAANRSTATKRKTGSTSASASSAPSKTPKVATTKSSRRPPPAQPKKARAKQQNRQDIDIDTALALVDPAVNEKTFAVAHKYDNGRHATIAKGLKRGSDEKEAAAQAWKRATKNPNLKAQALGMVFTDLQAMAAASVLLEDLDPARRTAFDTLGGAAAFGFGTAAAAPAAGAGATGTVGDIVLPGPSAAAMPAWWRQAYAEQQEKNRELQTQQTKDRAELQAQNQSMLNQLGNSNLIQQQMLGQLDQHRIAIGDLQNGQQQQGAAIGDLQNGQQQQGAVIVDLQNGQQQQRAAIAKLQDWQQRVIVEGALGGTKTNLDGSRFGSIPACSAAPPAAVGFHDAAGAAQAAPITPRPPSLKMELEPDPDASTLAGADDDRLYMMFDDTSALPSAELKAFTRQSGVEGLPGCIFGSIVEYSRNFFRVNEIIRKNGVARLPKKDSIMVRSVSLALEALPVFSFGQYCVYRGVYFEEQKDVFRFRDLWHDGKPFVEPSFLSSSALHIESPELNAFNGRNTYFAILSKTGRLIQRHSDEDWKKEAEVLFDLGTSFRILSFDDTMPGKEHGTGLDQAGRYRIVMEEI